jgi:hypothetical protein
MPKETCIMCGKLTHEEITTHVDFRTGYIEGAGQLCLECYRKGSSSSRNMITIPEDYIKSYPNDFELGGKVREYYYSMYNDRETEPENQWICQFCGQDTSNVDNDYLHGTDHLTCVLSNEKTNPQ